MFTNKTLRFESAYDFYASRLLFLGLAFYGFEWQIDGNFTFSHEFRH